MSVPMGTGKVEEEKDDFDFYDQEDQTERVMKKVVSSSNCYSERCQRNVSLVPIGFPVLPFCDTQSTEPIFVIV